MEAWVSELTDDARGVEPREPSERGHKVAASGKATGVEWTGDYAAFDQVTPEHTAESDRRGEVLIAVFGLV